MKTIVAVMALAALIACGKEAATSSESAAAPKAPEPSADPAAAPIEGEADSAWIELMGVWAPTGACQVDRERWIIEAERFSLYEMHCAIESLQLLQNGVRATAQCAVEGDDDGLPDIFSFLRQGDGSLTVVQEANGAMTTGLFPCEDGEGIDL
jgi:hypothetical protein